MKRLLTLGFMCLLVTGLAGCGRKTALSLPPPPAEHPAATTPAPDSPVTGSNTHP